MFRFARLSLLTCLVILCCSLPCQAEGDEATPSKYGTITGQFRTYYLIQRNRGTEETFSVVKESLAAGGILKYESPWLADHFGAGLAGYFSMPLIDAFNATRTGGTGLLSERNTDIYALGEAYLKTRFAQSEVRLWRQRLETPFINGNDTRMLPQTFEAYGITSKDVQDLELSLFWVDQEKARDTQLFQPMTKVAGKRGTLGGVIMTGADRQASDALAMRFWNYYADNLDNTFFTQAKYLFGDPDDVACEITFQGMDQHSVGESIYNTAEIGLLGVLKVKGFDFSLGGTIVDDSKSVRHSWGPSPFFNTMVSYNFARAGEQTLYLGMGYDFARAGLDGFRTDVAVGRSGSRRGAPLELRPHRIQSEHGIYLRRRAERMVRPEPLVLSGRG